jgi:uncharacterized protein YgiB involved in biofilm formation
MSEPRKRKRSSSIALTTMMAGAASLNVAACDSSTPANWNDANATGRGQVEAFQYASLEACKTADEVPDADCEKGWAAAQADDAKNGPRYQDRATCEEVYGDGNCVPRTAQGGGSFFGPLLTGFIIGRMLDGGGSYYRGTGLYRRDGRYGGGYATTWGGGLSRDYATGRTTVSRSSIDPPDAIRQAPAKVQTRTSVVSRGGFGGGRGFGFGG